MELETKVEEGASSPSSHKLLLHSFGVLTLTLLTLLLPLSLLLLSRLGAFSSLPPHTFSISTVDVLLSAATPTLHLLVPILTFLSLLHVTTGYFPSPGLRLAWTVLTILQVSVGLGAEATIAAGVSSDANVYQGWNNIRRFFFVVGVYETTVFWSKAFAKKVVDDAIYGVAAMEETWKERVAIGLAFGISWLALLRVEVEGLVLEERGIGGWSGFVRWLVGQLMAVIGATRVLKWLVSVGIKRTKSLFPREGKSCGGGGGSCKCCTDGASEIITEV